MRGRGEGDVVKVWSQQLEQIYVIYVCFIIFHGLQKNTLGTA